MTLTVSIPTRNKSSASIVAVFSFSLPSSINTRSKRESSLWLSFFLVFDLSRAICVYFEVKLHSKRKLEGTWVIVESKKEMMIPTSITGHTYSRIMSRAFTYSSHVGVENNFQNGIFNSKIATFVKNLWTAFINSWVSKSASSSRQRSLTSKATWAMATRVPNY